MGDGLWDYDEAGTDSEEAWVTSQPDPEEEPPAKSTYRPKKKCKTLGMAALCMKLPESQDMQDDLLINLADDDDDALLELPHTHQNDAKNTNNTSGKQSGHAAGPQSQPARQNAVMSEETRQLLERARQQAQQRVQLQKDDDDPEDDADDEKLIGVQYAGALRPMASFLHSQLTPGASAAGGSADAPVSLLDDDDDDAQAAAGVAGAQQQAAAPAGGGDADKITLLCKWGEGDGDSIKMRMAPHDPFSKLFEAFRQVPRIKALMDARKAAKVGFVWDGDALRDDDTPEALGIEGDEAIDVRFKA